MTLVEKAEIIAAPLRQVHRLWQRSLADSGEVWLSGSSCGTRQLSG